MRFVGVYGGMWWRTNSALTQQDSGKDSRTQKIDFWKFPNVKFLTVNI
jgi:hypothetical protein